jgi:UDP-apiose/xylose synthase
MTSAQTIALFGAGGFIGSNLVEFLLRETDHRVIGLDLTDEKLSHLSSDRLTFRRMDIRTDLGLADDAIRQADVVVDLIAYANPSVYIESPLEVVELNLMENLKITRSCIEHGRRLIQYSSCEVYGKPSLGEPAWKEDEADLVYGPIQAQRWVYAASKQLLERMLYAYGRAGELEFTIIRPFNFIGPRMDYLVPAGAMGGPRVLAHFISALLTKGPMYLVDGGHVHRTFTHIEDANRAFLAVFEQRGQARNQIFNIGTPANNATIRELAVLVRELYEELVGEPPGSELVEVSGEDFYGPGYEDVDRIPPDISKLRALGWEPRYDLRATFRDALRFYLQRANQLAAI